MSWTHLVIWHSSSMPQANLVKKTLIKYTPSWFICTQYVTGYLVSPTQPGGATLTVNTNGNGELMSIKRVPSNTSVSGLLGTSYGGVYTHVWKALMQLVLDPCPKVADMTKTITDFVKQKVPFHSCGFIDMIRVVLFIR